jgi:hypothetical protein
MEYTAREADFTYEVKFRGWYRNKSAPRGISLHLYTEDTRIRELSIPFFLYFFFLFEPVRAAI